MRLREYDKSRDFNNSLNLFISLTPGQLRHVWIDLGEDTLLKNAGSFLHLRELTLSTPDTPAISHLFRGMTTLKSFTLHRNCDNRRDFGELEEVIGYVLQELEDNCAGSLEELTVTAWNIREIVESSPKFEENVFGGYSMLRIIKFSPAHLIYMTRITDEEEEEEELLCSARLIDLLPPTIEVLGLLYDDIASHSEVSRNDVGLRFINSEYHMYGMFDGFVESRHGKMPLLHQIQLVETVWVEETPVVCWREKYLRSDCDTSQVQFKLVDDPIDYRTFFSC